MATTRASPRSALRPTTATLAPAAAKPFRHRAAQHARGSDHHRHFVGQVKKICHGIILDS